MDLRIGVTNAPRELSLELADDTDRALVQQQVAEAVGREGAMLTFTDRKGRIVLVPAAKVAYVELGNPEGERRIGFGG